MHGGTNLDSVLTGSISTTGLHWQPLTALFELEHGTEDLEHMWLRLLRQRQELQFTSNFMLSPEGGGEFVLQCDPTQRSCRQIVVLESSTVFTTKVFWGLASAAIFKWRWRDGLAVESWLWKRCSWCFPKLRNCANWTRSRPRQEEEGSRPCHC